MQGIKLYLLDWWMFAYVVIWLYAWNSCMCSNAVMSIYQDCMVENYVHCRLIKLNLPFCLARCSFYIAPILFYCTKILFYFKWLCHMFVVVLSVYCFKVSTTNFWKIKTNKCFSANIKVYCLFFVGIGWINIF